MHKSRSSFKAIKIVIVDDHVLFTAGLIRLFEEIEDVEVIGTAKSGEEILEKIENLNPDIIIMDISFPSADGIQIGRRIKKLLPDVKIILLTMHKEAQFIKAALLPEISGYVLKDDAFEELLQAIKVVSSGGRYFSSFVNEKLRELKEKGERISSLLTPREREVLKLIARGLSNKEIAWELKLSLKTVDTHRTNLMQKLDLHSTAELVRYALEAGLVD